MARGDYAPTAPQMVRGDPASMGSHTWSGGPPVTGPILGDHRWHDSARLTQFRMFVLGRFPFVIA